MKLRPSFASVMYVFSGVILLMAGVIRWQVAKGQIYERESECVVRSQANSIRFENLLGDRFLEDCGRIGGLVRSMDEGFIVLLDGSRLLMAPRTELRIDGVFEKQVLIHLRLGEVTIQTVSNEGFYVKAEEPLKKIDAGMVGERLSATKAIRVSADSSGTTRKVAGGEKAPVEKSEPTLASQFQIDPSDKSIVFFDRATAVLVNVANSSQEFCTFSLLRDGHPYRSLRTPPKEITQVELDIALYSGEVHWVVDQCAQSQEKLTGSITIEKMSPAAFNKAVASGNRILMLD